MAGTPVALTGLNSMALARLLKAKIMEDAATEGKEYDPGSVGRLLFNTVMGMANGMTLLGWTEQEHGDLEEGSLEGGLVRPQPIVNMIAKSIKHVAGAEVALIKALSTSPALVKQEPLAPVN